MFSLPSLSSDLKVPIENNAYAKFGGGGGENKVHYGKFGNGVSLKKKERLSPCLLYTSPSPRDGLLSRMPSSA